MVTLLLVFKSWCILIIHSCYSLAKVQVYYHTFIHWPNKTQLLYYKTDFFFLLFKDRSLKLFPYSTISPYNNKTPFNSTLNCLQYSFWYWCVSGMMFIAWWWEYLSTSCPRACTMISFFKMFFFHTADIFQSLFAFLFAGRVFSHWVHQPK